MLWIQTHSSDVSGQDRSLTMPYPIDQAKEDPSGEKRTLHVSQPAEPYRRGWWAGFSSAIRSCGSVTIKETCHLQRHMRISETTTQPTNIKNVFLLHQMHMLIYHLRYVNHLTFDSATSKRRAHLTIEIMYASFHLSSAFISLGGVARWANHVTLSSRVYMSTVHTWVCLLYIYSVTVCFILVIYISGIVIFTALNTFYFIVPCNASLSIDLYSI